jgi:hypothetical protein
MEGFTFYFWTLFFLTIANVFLFLLFIIKLLKIKLSIVVPLLFSVIIIAVDFPFFNSNFFLFASLSNSLLTLMILIIANAVILFLKK